MVSRFGCSHEDLRAMVIRELSGSPVELSRALVFVESAWRRRRDICPADCGCKFMDFASDIVDAALHHSGASEWRLSYEELFDCSHIGRASFRVTGGRVPRFVPRFPEWVDVEA